MPHTWARLCTCCQFFDIRVEVFQWSKHPCVSSPLRWSQDSEEWQRLWKWLSVHFKRNNNVNAVSIRHLFPSSRESRGRANQAECAILRSCTKGGRCFLFSVLQCLSNWKVSYENSAELKQMKWLVWSFPGSLWGTGTATRWSNTICQRKDMFKSERILLTKEKNMSTSFSL